MAPSRQIRLRAGIIGLGRLWEARHKPALARMSDRFQIVAVYDQVARRAEMEASRLGCEVALGLEPLIRRDDIDVVYLLSPQWFGFHALELACERGKAVYCALPLSADPAELERLDALVRETKARVMTEFARRFYPITLRLKELFATKLGKPRLIVGQSRVFNYDRRDQPGPSTQMAPAPLLVDPGSYLIDWCRFLYQAEPTSVQAYGASVLPAPREEDHDFETFVAEFPGGGLAQLCIGRHHRAAWGDSNTFLPQPGVQVYAERGVAWVEMPDKLCWNDAEGNHEEKLPLEPGVGEILNDQFHRLARGDQSLASTWKDAVTAARLVGQLRQSHRDGRRVDVG